MYHFDISTGTCVHHRSPEKGDAVCVWQRRQEERADQQTGRHVRGAAARAPDLARRLPEPRAHEGAARPPRLHQVPPDQAAPAGGGR